MALPPPSLCSTVTFFGTCTTFWTSLSLEQKDSCIGEVRLTRQIDKFYAWLPAGELNKQYNDIALKEYSAVVNIRQEKKSRWRQRRGRTLPVSHPPTVELGAGRKAHCKALYRRLVEKRPGREGNDISFPKPSAAERLLH
jgi:hypothetical protein